MTFVRDALRGVNVGRLNRERRYIDLLQTVNFRPFCAETLAQTRNFGIFGKLTTLEINL